MSIKLGTKNIVGAKLGSHNICKIYKGSALYMDFCKEEEIDDFCDDFDYNSYPPYSILVSTNENSARWPSYTYNDYSNYTGGTSTSSAGGMATFYTEPNWNRHLITLTDYNTFPNGVEGLFKLFDNVGNVTEVIFVGEWTKPIKTITMAFQGNPLKYLDITQLRFAKDIYYQNCVTYTDSFTVKVRKSQKEFMDNTDNHNNAIMSLWFQNADFVYCGSDEEVQYPPYSILYSTNSQPTSSKFYINGKATTDSPQPNKTDELYTFKVDGVLTSLRNTFKSMGNLTSVKFVGEWDTSKVTDMYNFIYINSNLVSVSGKIADFDITSVTTMNGVISSNPSLESVDISNWKLSDKLTNAYAVNIQGKNIYCSCDFKNDLYARSMNEKVKTLTEFQNMVTPEDCPLADTNNTIYYKANSNTNNNYFRTDNIQTNERPSSTTGLYISFGEITFRSDSNRGLYQFANNITNLTYIEFLPTWKTENATSAGYMFNGCTVLAEIKGLENINWTNISNLSYMFQNNAKLKEIDLSALEQCKNIDNVTYMFSGCMVLDSINFGNADLQNATNFDRMFYSCSAIKKIKCNCATKNFIEENYTAMGMSASVLNNIVWDTDCETDYPPYTIRYTTTENAGNPCFRVNEWDNYYIEKGTDIVYTFPIDNLTSLFNFTEWNKDDFEKIEFLGDWDCTNLTSVRAMFVNKTSLKELKGLNKLDVSKCTSYRETFSNIGVEELDISEWVLNDKSNWLNDNNKIDGGGYNFIKSDTLKRLYADNVYCDYINYSNGTYIPNAEYIRTNQKMKDNLMNGAPSDYLANTQFDIVS